MLILAVLLAQTATPAAPAPPAPSEIVAAAPAADWAAIPASDLLVMTLAPDAKGRPRRVVIQLMPAPFSQGWVRNIRKLAAAHWYDGVSVNRVQDNYVVQWGDATEKKALPAGLETMPESDYVVAPDRLPATPRLTGARLGRDPYVREGFAFLKHGWPLGTDIDQVWPVHCYSMVGVGRDVSPNTGNGAELYTVIGHAPRHLDRNIALVGRVIEGIEHLSSLPRGTEALGFYKTPEERTPIVSVLLASELPAAERPRFEYLSTESATFARYADARANRHDAFFIRPAGGADVCNVPVPVRRRP
jgi:cyclophilin family peptidyl-prolyl cis-trans isomerase